ncbi:MAG: Rab family GTPase [Candidatus Heimdallarchaeota archaeon]
MDYKEFKVCIFGDGGVGKTTLTHRYLTGVFKDTYKTTIGMDFYIKKLEINGSKLSMQIWDFAGEEKFRFLLKSSLIGAQGTIFMYDITRYSTFKNLNNWFEVFTEVNEIEKQTVPIILVGAKLDLKEARAVSKEHAIEYSKNLGCTEFLECSSKTGEQVNKVFESMGRIMIKTSKS